jgi:hypothetical protein
VSSDWGKQISQERFPRVLYADHDAQTCWQFPGLDSVATYTNYNSLLNALQNFRNADVIATYDEGNEDAGSTQANLSTILAKTDSFFVQGGRLLTYYDFNRVDRELVASHYISGLTTTQRPDTSATLYRNLNGNIGIYFPESFVHYGFDYLQYTTDPNVKIEVQDIFGRPVVISKKVSNGLLVVSGIWSFRDDGALREALGVPLLGLNSASKNQMLTGLLANVKATYSQSTFDRAIVLSNTDSLFLKADALSWTTSYLNSFSGTHPQITTINLLDGQDYMPAYFTDQQIQYYGSGYLQKAIADAFDGRHFETHLYIWNYICSTLSPYSYPVADSMSVSAVVDSGSGQLKQIREVDPSPADANKARFFIGSSSIANNLNFNVRAVFSGIAGGKSASEMIYLNHDTTKMDKVVPAMLANENLNDLFNRPVADTAAIVNLAMQYRLLCDYTALIALEPNDTLHFMKNPFDESTLGVASVDNANIPDSLTLAAYPSPFNNQTKIVVTATKPSAIRVSVYNILGQLVRVLALDDLVLGAKTYGWNGTNAHNNVVSSGVYFIHLVAKEKINGSTKTLFKKIVFLK